MKNQLILETSMSRILSKIQRVDVAIFTAFRGLRENDKDETHRITWGARRSDGKREILEPPYLKGYFAKDVTEANNIANRLFLQTLEIYGLPSPALGATSVLGSYMEKGNTKPTNENSFVIENHGSTSEDFAARILHVAKKFYQDSISLIPRVKNLRDSYLFIVDGSRAGITSAYLGKLQSIGKKNMNDGLGKTVVGNKQIVYDVDWSKEYDADAVYEYIRRRREGEKSTADEDYEDIIRHNRMVHLGMERNFLKKHKESHDALTPQDRMRLQLIDDIIEDSY